MNTVENIITHKLHLPDEMLQRFVALTQSRCLKKKDFFVEQGQVCHHLGIVEKGVLRSYIEKEGEEYIKDFYLPDSLSRLKSLNLGQ